MGDSRLILYSRPVHALLCAVALAVAFEVSADDERIARASRTEISTFIQALERWQSPASRPEAIAFLKRAAAGGHAGAQGFLGMLYFTGDSVQRDPVLARRWLQPAAAQGHAQATYLLAMLYRSGQGIPADPARARELMLRAADLHSPPALIAAAQLLLREPGDETARKHALLYLHEGVRLGEPAAMWSLGLELYGGAHTTADPAQACRLFQQAADKNFAQAQLWFAQCVAQGRGVVHDAARAESLFATAAHQLPLAQLNDFAWRLSVSPVEALRDGTRAVALMERALADPAARNAIHLDTLAAAYAETGRFDDAAKTQQTAIDLAPQASLNEVTRAEMVRRLALYRSGSAYRE